MKIGIGASPHDREVRAGLRVLYLIFSSSAPSFYLVLDFFIGMVERRMDAPEREKCCPAPPVFTVGEGRVERTEAISATRFSINHRRIRREPLRRIRAMADVLRPRRFEQ